MKKGLWPITIGIALILYQILGISGTYIQFLDAHSVCYPIMGFTIELLIGNVVLYYIALYIVGALSIPLIIWGFNAFIKDSPESLKTNLFVMSYRAIRDTKILVQCAVLIALYVVLDMFQIKLPFLEFTFAFIALAGIAYIAGPVTGFYCGGICEILGYLLAPKTGPLHLGITFTAMLTGFVMGLFLYKKEIKLWRVIASRSIVSIFLNLGLNTYWISTLIGKAYIAMLPARALKSVLELPIDIILILLVIKLIAKINNYDNKKTKKKAK